MLIPPHILYYSFYQVGVIQQLQQDNARLQAEVGKSRHIETGTLDCTYKDENWAGRENGWKYDSQFASFTKVYENTPIVFISMLSNDHLQGDDVDYYVKVHSVNTNGFTMRCYSLNGPTRKVYNLNVQWIAFASWLNWSQRIHDVAYRYIISGNCHLSFLIDYHKKAYLLHRYN